jgi:hypothetical protein
MSEAIGLDGAINYYAVSAAALETRMMREYGNLIGVQKL